MPDEKYKFDGTTPLPGRETSRRRNIKNLTVQCHLLINNKKVAMTQKYKVNWPNFTADIMEQFQVHLFTMPSSIKIEININGSVADVVNVQVPGEHVKTLTCAV